jgi:hypothetical protein
MMIQLILPPAHSPHGQAAEISTVESEVKARVDEGRGK